MSEFHEQTGKETNDRAGAIKPFRISVSKEELNDLHERISKTRWPDRLPGDEEWERGVPSDYLKKIAQYWNHGYDWRKHEAALNELPQFTAEMEGQTIHFFHLRSKHADATPLIITHGWPSSPVEFLKVIEPLTNPANGKDAFHLVIPSLPGYGFSRPFNGKGWGNLFRVAQAWDELMNRLGYESYAVQGTDVGTGVAGILGMIAPERVLGIHLTGTLAAMPFSPAITLEGLSDEDRIRAERFNEYQANGLGYLHMQATRPQTLAYSLNDSPVGQLAWILEKFQDWTDPAARLPEDAVDLDQLLTSVSIFWFTGSGASSAHSVYEGMKVYREMAAMQTDGANSQWEEKPGPPTGVAVFAADTTIRSLMDPAGKIKHWSEFPSGGHFPAMEAPELLAKDIQAFFRSIGERG